MIVFPALTFARQAPIPGWTMYVSTQDHFTVELPGRPTVSTNSSSTRGIVASTRNYIVKTPEINAVVSATTLNDRGSKTAQDVSRGILVGLMRRVNGKPGPTQGKTYSGRSGQETRFQDGTGHFGALWVTSTPGHVYSLTILGVRKVPKAEALRFFTSFHLG